MVAGCGGGSDDDDDSSPNPTSTSTGTGTVTGTGTGTGTGAVTGTVTGTGTSTATGTGAGVCPHVDLGSSTSVTYDGNTTGLTNLVTSSRLEWTDAPDDALLFTVPENGDYELIVTAEPSSNGGCGASVWDYGTDSFYDVSWCPQPGSTTEIDGFYVSAGYPYTWTQGMSVIIWFSCTYWADVKSGAYTLTIQKQ